MDLKERRNKYLGNADKFFYEEPLHIVKGEDVWLESSNGERYLDVYNNVAHIGHSNPIVVEAIAAQAATLNTNTRYIHENIIELECPIWATLLYTSRYRSPLELSNQTSSPLTICRGSW